ncbi:hypothetical protein J437_LFUL015292 [Ladona fulva]|uniref:RING-CH-type domain-containing protein n=1 Tax=Ladona fulva TaxID=123851 RepID=A0A8K0KMZ4_LADFU|nr:hypothetical protein J437_LFUL015292 [Ladona fulva]
MEEQTNELKENPSVCCRICQQGPRLTEPFASPCDCKGSMGAVHPSCLHRWLATSGRSRCEICLYPFRTVAIQRYGLLEGLRLWMDVPERTRDFAADFMVVILLTMATIGLVVVCWIGTDHFIFEGKKLGMSRTWSMGALGFFVGVLLVGYTVTLCLMVRDMLCPWWRWWRRGISVIEVTRSHESSQNSAGDQI